MPDNSSNLPKPSAPTAQPATPAPGATSTPSPVASQAQPPIKTSIPSATTSSSVTPMTPPPTATVPPSSVMKVSMKPPTPSPIPAAPVATPSPIQSTTPVTKTTIPSATPSTSVKPMSAPPTTPPPQGGKPAAQPASQPAAAQPKKSVLRFLPFVLLLSLLIGIGGFAYYWFMVRDTSDSSQVVTPAKKTEITYWGLWEPTTVMEEVFNDFEAKHPEYEVNYIQQSPADYRERLQAEIAKGSGPDVFRFHASWAPMLVKELSPLPERVMTAEEFASTFYPSALEQLTINDTIVGIPLMVDGLGLYYNTDIFSIANLTPPTDWDEVKTVAQQLAIKSGDQITRGGIALGTTSNVEHFPEIVGVLMLQNGADPEDPTTQQAQDAMLFYLQFAETLQVWDDTLPPSTEAFAKGNVAMMIAPSWRVHEIKDMNANLQFEIAPLPQLPNTERVTWASYWAEGVSAQSDQKDAAWELIEYLSTPEVQQQFYSEASQVRAFGELYSRTDLASTIVDQPYVGAYIQDAPYAKYWFMNAYTHDNGINDRINKYYEDALNKGSGQLDASVVTLKQGIDQVLQEFKLKAAPTAIPEEAQ